jgi:hypothetical protein
MSPRRGMVAAAAVTFLLTALPAAYAGEYGGAGGLLPAGTNLDNEALDRPRELFKSEHLNGTKSYMVILGDMAFSSPLIFGGPARQVGLSCDTCHINGTSNPALYVPGMSLVPGTFDTTGPLFNPKANNGIVDAVTPPSLRGARFLWPYGHDGRMPSLRDFVHGVVVNEFKGPEPSSEILEALVAYITDIDFLPNRRLDEEGKLMGIKSAAEKRGEALFYKPFAHDPSLSCASCHVPSGGYLDHQTHDVGSEGIFKTPTLLNVDFNAPYFHDGRYNTLEDVIAHFDRMFYLGLSAQDRDDLVAYVKAIGDGDEPYVRDSVDLRLKEISTFVTVLDTAIPEQNKAIVSLTVDTVGRELREFTEMFPGRKDTSVSGGGDERAKARGALDELVLDLRQVDIAAADGHFDDAAAALAAYRTRLAAVVPVLKAGEPWSLFNPTIHDAHFANLRQLFAKAVDPAVAAARLRFDKD